MNLYKTTGETEDGDEHIIWSGTQSDAGKHRKELKAKNCKGVGTEEIEVPTKKAELIAWLNDNAA